MEPVPLSKQRRENDMTLRGEEAVRELLAHEVKENGLCTWCKRHHLDPGNVSNILSGRKRMHHQVAIALGFKPVTYYEENRDD